MHPASLHLLISLSLSPCVRQHKPNYHREKEEGEKTCEYKAVLITDSRTQQKWVLERRRREKTTFSSLKSRVSEPWSCNQDDTMRHFTPLVPLLHLPPPCSHSLSPFSPFSRSRLEVIELNAERGCTVHEDDLRDLREDRESWQQQKREENGRIMGSWTSDHLLLCPEPDSLSLSLSWPRRVCFEAEGEAKV